MTPRRSNDRSRRRAGWVAVLAVLLVGVGPIAPAAVATGGPDEGDATSAGVGLMPDLRTVVPRHVQLVNAQNRDVLRFSNSIANTGAGPLAMRPEPPPREAELETTAIQEFRDSTAIHRCGTQPKQVTACYNVVAEVEAGTFVYHPEHNHWHIGSVALFEVRVGSPDGPVAVGAEAKVSFCLLDIVKLDGKASTSERGFWDCWTSYQGISAGWADQYHHATTGQQLDITDLPDGDDYYLVSTSNPDGLFVESDYTNNNAWVRLSLSSPSKGNRKLAVIDRSPCDSPGLCGEFTANRG